MVIRFFSAEGRVSEIRPEHRYKPERVGITERLRNLLYLTVAPLGAEVYGSPDGDRPHLKCLIDVREHYLVVFVRVSEEFVMIELYQKRNPMRVFPGDSAQHPER